MKWFEHDTDAHMNPKLQLVIDKFGLEGYGYYWALVELVGKYGSDYRVKSEKNWKNLLKKFVNVEVEKQEMMLAFFGEINLIDLKSLKKGELYIPKLAERSDEYTKKLRRKYGQTPDNDHLQDNTTQDNTLHNSILAIIDAFKIINPETYKGWFGNKTQRKACERLLEHHSIENILEVIAILPTSNSFEYVPTVFTPLQLADKWSSLGNALKKHEQKLKRKLPNFI